MAARSRRDLPLLMVEGCVAVLGAGRPDWCRAMLAELAQIDGRRTRWVFALGCVRSIVFGMHPAGSQRVVTATALAAAVSSVALVTAALVRYPGVVSGARSWIAVGIFVAVLLVYMVGATRFGARLVDSGLHLTAALAGSAIAASWLALGLNSSVGGSRVLGVLLVGLGPILALTVGWLTTKRSASSRVGVGCVGLTALVAGFALFLLWVGETVATAGRPYDSGLLRDFRTSGATDLATYAVSDSLGTAMVLFVLVPLVSLASGLVGSAAAGTRTTRPHSAPATAQPGGSGSS